MVAFARVKYPRQNFLVMDARAICFEKAFDVVFSHAALHWVDNHEVFLRRAAAALRPGGRLVVACGGHGNAQGMVMSLHAIIRRKRWRDGFRGMPRPYFFYPVTDYPGWMEAANFQNHRVELIAHDVFYAGLSGLVDWLRTAWLPYSQRVPAPDRDEFMRVVADHYIAHHPPDEAGRVPVRLVRLEMTAMKKSSVK
jgi:trans-aconitate methyltransferase